MPRTNVQEYTRTLANGTKVDVASHNRAYEGMAADAGKTSSVEAHRKERLKEQGRVRRAAAFERGKAASVKGWAATKKRGKQTARLAKKGGKRLRKAARYAGRRRRTMAAACLVGGVAEVGAGLAWSTVGLVVTTVSILAATLAGGLFLGGKKGE